MNVEQVLEKLARLYYEKKRVTRQIQYYVSIANNLLNGSETCAECADEYADDCARYDGGDDE